MISSHKEDAALFLMQVEKFRLNICSNLKVTTSWGEKMNTFTGEKRPKAS